jgi:hypothetical protein
LQSCRDIGLHRYKKKPFKEFIKSGLRDDDLSFFKKWLAVCRHTRKVNCLESFGHMYMHMSKTIKPKTVQAEIILGTYEILKQFERLTIENGRKEKKRLSSKKQNKGNSR